MFIPKRVIFEKDSLDYEAAKNILNKFKDKKDVEIINITSNKLKQHIPGEDFYAQYREGKKTLVVGTKKSLKFQSCKPSAHYQLPLISGCMGQCEYCYLNTKLGDKPFVKVHVNIDEILSQAQKYIDERLPEITIFEGAATSDPIPVEPYTHSLEKAIVFFGKHENARFRFVTKYNDIDSLLDLEHNGHTEMRFSINTSSVINKYEHATASRDLRIEASIKAAKAGYPIGFLVAPVFIYPNWKEEYHDLLLSLSKNLPRDLKTPVTFEIISHRYTSTAKNIILQVFPESELPMSDEERKFKYGQFGYGKYVYPKENIDEMKQFFIKEIEDLFENKEIKYVI
ncbi:MULTISPECIES: spore photoproduct lyase [Clostridium]|jgi:DNA repair photolyase|uniref:Spore photoproduct lyase n=3 Tax=Clostridium TaxID=1485 RepID=A0AAE2RRE8_CLOBE|nr:MULTISPECIES: spore photoproduct lyase [Clostridium]ABR36471.1 Radical SAM domain protein [Clostridium beijerinckii NCIMB 8052]AIU03493.1 radical SAM domain-containing protein [Clostridium beijerinckii ATCC 35702]AVK48344.1 spore photoproduct lyase [Clostridium sp. MF28]MBC2459808.1 spore photoproduct lyase [Clostridium beijerinckii]MBC2477293.1 spore photoproduct lyase [Clostridium beijerinckii]